MKIAIATDAWHPQVNGVVRALSATADVLRSRGHEVVVIRPGHFRTIACPTYPEIRLAVGCGRAVDRRLDDAQADAVHVATEGPIGWAARRWCVARGRPFTTSFHTRFPDYVAMRTRLPARWIWPVMRRFHGPASRTFAVSAALAAELEQRGIRPVHHWPLGVDLAQFNPSVAPHPAIAALRHPVMLNVGRVAVEKNIEAFLDCPVEGSKVVVGDGPDRFALQARYPHVHFFGALHGTLLAAAYRAADVFVFPSRTDTFGLVNVEALACGLPVAAFPVPGPLDIIGRDGCGLHGGGRPIGALHEKLGQAIAGALAANRAACAEEALRYGWDSCTDAFIAGLAARCLEPPVASAA